MSKTPFKLKSGNSPLFKHMGSSPVKEIEFVGTVKDSITGQDLPATYEGGTSPEAQERAWYLKSKFPGGKYGSVQSEQPTKTEAATTSKKTPPKKTPPKKGKGKSYADAYAKADQALYGKLSLEEYTAEAKRQQKSYDAGKGWDAPTKPMKGKSTKTTYTTSGEGVNNVDTSKQSVAVGPQTEATAKVNEEAFPTTSAEVEPFKPLVTSRKERRQEKLARKSSGRLSKKEIKYEKLASKAESALAKGKKGKAKRLLKRANKKLRSGGVNTTDAGVGKTSDRLIDLDFS